MSERSKSDAAGIVAETTTEPSAAEAPRGPVPSEGTPSTDLPVWSPLSDWSPKTAPQRKTYVDETIEETALPPIFEPDRGDEPRPRAGGICPPSEAPVAAVRPAGVDWETGTLKAWENRFFHRWEGEIKETWVDAGNGMQFIGVHKHAYDLPPLATIGDNVQSLRELHNPPESAIEGQECEYCDTDYWDHTQFIFDCEPGDIGPGQFADSISPAGWMCFWDDDGIVVADPATNEKWQVCTWEVQNRPAAGPRITWLCKRNAVDDPCDEDWMREISS